MELEHNTRYNEENLNLRNHLTLLTQQSANTIGYVHSIETMGAVDGPGLRTVVFLQGCPLKCKFCHNIDCAVQIAGNQISVQKLTTQLFKNKPYWDKYTPPNCKTKNCISGGITISGGEPTFQPLFLRDLLQYIKQESVHTALDTCLVTEQEVLKELIPYVDLWMVSIKHTDKNVHRRLTGATNTIIHQNLQYLDTHITQHKQKNAQIRIRLLIIPKLTDSTENIQKTGEIAKNLTNLEAIEILPYGTHGKYKWIQIYGKYELEGIPNATSQDIQRAKKILTPYNIPIICTEEHTTQTHTTKYNKP